jgi:hypothetical protein
MKWLGRAGLTLALCDAPLVARGAEIWLSGLAPSMFTAMRPGEQSDFLALFQPDAPWPHAASTVQVFKIYSQFIWVASDREIRDVFADLQRRKIALALEAGLMTATRDCGRGEGYGAAGAAKQIADRIIGLGGDLRYVAMDEPLWFGHQFDGATACHRSITDIAHDIATNVAVFKRAFPAVQVGDIEPFGSTQPPRWAELLIQWSRAYRDAVGQPLAFLHVDINWSGPWQSQVAVLVPQLRTIDLKFGIIYNGDHSDQTDLAWTHHAEQRFAAIEADPALAPEQAVLQTWMPQPAHMLPETQPGTMTWLVNRYVATRTHLTVRRFGGRLEGQLTTSAGHPLAGASITISAAIPSQKGAPAIHEHSGKVPPRASAAVFALRINAECDCSGPADIAIGPMLYHDDLTGQAVNEAFRPVSEGADAKLVRFDIRPGQAISQNTPPFLVTAKNPFTIQVPMRPNQRSAGSGYVALVFLDAQNKEVERLRIPFEPAERRVSVVTTDSQGRYWLLPDPDTLRASVGFRAEFLGDAQHRTATATQY